MVAVKGKEPARSLTESGETELRDLNREQLMEVVDTAFSNLDLYEERLADLEAELQEIGWLKLSWETSQDLSREGLSQLIQLSRVMYLRNPIIQHGLEVAADYVWAQGAAFTAPGKANDVLQGFLDDPKNLASFSSHAARIENDKRLGYDANIFFALFIDRSKSHVTVRTIPVEEILAGDIICNPEDKKDVWYYKRIWTKRTLESDGTYKQEATTGYYPDWRYEKETRKERPATTIGEVEIFWDAPVYHMRVGGLADGKWGIPTVYSAISWARAVTRNFEDFATISHALARFAFQITTKGGKRAVSAAKRKFQSTISDEAAIDQNPPPATGSTFIASDIFNLSAVSRAGAEPDTEKGRGLRLMASAGLGIPETILFGNADVGNMATAKTLDRPTELKMKNRQTLWADTFADIGGFVLELNVDHGDLPKDDTDQVTGDKVEQSTKVDVSFPPILETDPKDVIAAIVLAATLDNKKMAGTMTMKTVARLVMEVLGIDNIDELLEELFPEGSEGTLPGEEEPPLEPLAGPESPAVPELVPPAQEGEYLETLKDIAKSARQASASNGRSHG